MYAVGHVDSGYPYTSAERYGQKSERSYGEKTSFKEVERNKAGMDSVGMGSIANDI